MGRHLVLAGGTGAKKHDGLPFFVVGLQMLPSVANVDSDTCHPPDVLAPTAGFFARQTRR